MRAKLVRMLGGWSDKESFLDSLSDEDRDAVLTLAVEKLFNTVGKDDIFSKNTKGEWTLHGKPMMQAELMALVSEAKSVQESPFWKIVEKELDYHGNKKMREAANLPQLEAAKLFPFVWHVVRSKLAEVAGIQTSGANKQRGEQASSRVILG